MATRTARKIEIPVKEFVEERAHNCALDGPPHTFEGMWAAPARDRLGEDTVPALVCTSCGEVRILAIPDDA